MWELGAGLCCRRMNQPCTHWAGVAPPRCASTAKKHNTLPQRLRRAAARAPASCVPPPRLLPASPCPPLYPPPCAPPALQWVNVDEYSTCEPDAIVMTNPNRTLQVLNERYSGARLPARLAWPGSAGCRVWRWCRVELRPAAAAAGACLRPPPPRACRPRPAASACSRRRAGPRHAQRRCATCCPGKTAPRTTPHSFPLTGGAQTCACAAEETTQWSASALSGCAMPAQHSTARGAGRRMGCGLYCRAASVAARCGAQALLEAGLPDRQPLLPPWRLPHAAPALPATHPRHPPTPTPAPAQRVDSLDEAIAVMGQILQRGDAASKLAPGAR